LHLFFATCTTLEDFKTAYRLAIISIMNVENYACGADYRS